MADAFFKSVLPYRILKRAQAFPLTSSCFRPVHYNGFSPFSSHEPPELRPHLLRGRETTPGSEGNAAFVDEDYDRALEKYNTAIDLDDANAEYLVKRSAVHGKLGRYTDALVDANSALQADNTLASAHFRQGVAYYHLKAFEHANTSFLHAAACGDTSTATVSYLQKCQEALGARFQASLDSPMATPASVEPQPMPVTAATAAAANPDPRIKHDWYQTDWAVVVTVMMKDARAEDVQVDCTENSLSVSVRRTAFSEYNLHLDLWHLVVPDECKVSVLRSKIEIKLRKVSNVRWINLACDGTEAAAPAVIMSAPDVNIAEKEKHKHDKWDQLAHQVVEEEAKEELQGDAALNKLFKDIYKNANEETRRAMNKSFMESGGTVLSTNWSEIGAKPTEVKPPEGCEFKKY